MSGEPLAEVSYGAASEGPQAALPLASDGVQRVVWHMRHGDILIEIRGGAVYVNGARVEPAAEELRRPPIDKTATARGRR